jgi:hypothetical protein
METVFDLLDGQIRTEPLAPSVVSGQPYGVTQMVPDGWATNVTCVGDPARSANIDPLDIDLWPGETVTCSFESTIERGDIVVEKVTDPGGVTQHFTFETNWTAMFALTDGGRRDSGELLPTSEAIFYSVTEDLQDGWMLTDVMCLGGGDRTVPSTSIDLQPGETVTCTFENTAIADYDFDGDGVLVFDDRCFDTEVDSSMPRVDLKKHRYAWHGDGDGDGDSVFISGGDNGPVFTVTDTAGCSAVQIIEQLGLGVGHRKFGLSLSATRMWLELIENGP